MKAWLPHYRNKYPGGSVRISEESVDVYNSAGEHVVAVRKDGGGSWCDRSEEFGCRDRHDLAPIPKDSRIFKIDAKGALVKDELAAEREPLVKNFVEGDKVLSCEELKKAKKFDFDEKQRVLSR